DCGSPLVRDEGEAKWFCPNVDGCPTQIKGKIVHFLNRKAMNVIAGDATIEQLYNKGYVRDVADLYSLKQDHLLALDGWKEKAAQRFLTSLAESVNVPFERVLYAIGIRYVGETTAKSIARHFGDIDSLMKAGREEILSVPDVGEVIADSVTAWFADKTHRELIERLRGAGLRMKVEIEDKMLSQVLADKTIVISGNFSISREAMKSLIELHGGKNGSSVSARTSFLLAGEKAGPEKIKKAQALGVAIITEEEFMEMLPEQGESVEQAAQNTPSIAFPVQLSLF
ncbi:MAG: helix-hairpin-helix domain-containing protein, partial [Bacteroidales bacterium]|nr:helix-hairpin-helix domain-containing protein [Bacteroidales bacterium]